MTTGMVVTFSTVLSPLAPAPRILIFFLRECFAGCACTGPQYRQIPLGLVVAKDDVRPNVPGCLVG